MALTMERCYSVAHAEEIKALFLRNERHGPVPTPPGPEAVLKAN